MQKALLHFPESHMLSHNYNFILLDAEMNPIQYVKASKKNDYKIQGIDATSDYILVAQSPKYSSQAYNIITVYDWDGNYIAKINAKKGYEIESIFHIGKKYYASFYRSYYKIYYQKEESKEKIYEVHAGQLRIPHKWNLKSQGRLQKGESLP